LAEVHFKQHYLGCLAHASYTIGSEGQAAVVDPRRDVDEYVENAKAEGLRILWVIETHLHADFVSGYRELAERTGAQVVFGAKAAVTFPHRAVKDGDEIPLGSLTLRVLETPGHTPESISIVVMDHGRSDQPWMVLTGDTLFVGDVGRPDLAGGRGLTPETMAGLLYDSLHTKLLALPDSTLVYPAHGAGSLCGRNMSDENSSTIGAQRRTNYALQPMPKERFVQMMTSELPEVPRYFPLDVELNRSGAPALSGRALPRALAPLEVTEGVERGARLLDVRESMAFGAGHIPGSINVGLSGQFASWAGSLLGAEVPLVIIADSEAEVGEAQRRLARVGLEKVVGYLAGGIPAWDRGLATLIQLSVGELKERLGSDPPQVYDVRRASEYQAGHVPGARNLPLNRLELEIASLDSSRPTAVICAGGYRSSAAASLLARHGFLDLANVRGGTSGWLAAGYAVETDTAV
jgi:hydroxyacylglutathione hydrolase